MSHPSTRETGPTVQVTPPYHIDALTIEDGRDIAMWRYPGPWAVFDSLEPPRPDEGYWAVRDANGQLVGYCCFGESARVPGLAGAPGMLDVALGLRPELVGRGLSAEFARAVVRHARKVAEGRRLRCVVAAGNEAGRKAAERAGFVVSGVHDVRGGALVPTYLVFTQD